MTKLAMSLITFKVGVRALPKTPAVPLRIAGVHTQWVPHTEDKPAHYLVTADNLRLCFLGLKGKTSRSRAEGDSDPPLKPGRTYPIVPYRSAPGYARVLIKEAEPVFLSDTTQEVVDAEGYGWLGLTVDGFINGIREFRRLKSDANPPMWRYSFSMVKFRAPSELELALIRARIAPRSSQSTLL